MNIIEITLIDGSVFDLPYATKEIYENVKYTIKNNEFFEFGLKEKEFLIPVSMILYVSFLKMGEEEDEIQQ